MDFNRKLVSEFEVLLWFLWGFGLVGFFVPKRFFTINYLDRHRIFVALHKLPEDHDESDQNGFSRKEKKIKRIPSFKSLCLSLRENKHSATHRWTKLLSPANQNRNSTTEAQWALTGTRGRSCSDTYLLCHLSLSSHLFSGHSHLRLPLNFQLLIWGFQTT